MPIYILVFVALFLYAFLLAAQYYLNYLTYKEYYTSQPNNFHFFIALFINLVITRYSVLKIFALIETIAGQVLDPIQWILSLFFLGLPMLYISFFMSKKKALTELQSQSSN